MNWTSASKTDRGGGVSRQIAITNCRLVSSPGRWSSSSSGLNPLGMEAITRMECRLLHGYELDFSPKNRSWWKFGPAFNLLLFLLLLLLVVFLLFLVFLLCGLLSSSLLLTLGRLRISSLFAWPHSEPLWQLLGGTL